MKKLLAILLSALVLSSCNKDYTDDDCREDYRCVEIGDGTGNFMSKNSSDPCPCE